MHSTCLKDAGYWATTFKKILGDQKATAGVMEFLATTREGERLRTEEQEEQERKKRRDEAWGLEEETMKGKEEEKEVNANRGERRGKEDQEGERKE